MPTPRSATSAGVNANSSLTRGLSAADHSRMHSNASAPPSKPFSPSVAAAKPAATNLPAPTVANAPVAAVAKACDAKTPPSPSLGSTEKISAGIKALVLHGSTSAHSSFADICTTLGVDVKCVDIYGDVCANYLVSELFDALVSQLHQFDIICMLTSCSTFTPGPPPLRGILPPDIYGVKTADPKAKDAIRVETALAIILLFLNLFELLVPCLAAGGALLVAGLVLLLDLWWLLLGG